jgi:hypothetical protein
MSELSTFISVHFSYKWILEAVFNRQTQFRDRLRMRGCLFIIKFELQTVEISIVLLRMR